MGFFDALDHVQGKTLYRLMSAACGSAFMLYGWDAGKLVPAASPALSDPKSRRSRGHPSDAPVSRRHRQPNGATDYSGHRINLQPSGRYNVALREFFRNADWQEGHYPSRLSFYMRWRPSPSFNLFRWSNYRGADCHWKWHWLHCFRRSNLHGIAPRKCTPLCGMYANNSLLV